MFFFLFAPKFSGSTVMSQVIANSVNGYLPSFTNNEGQMVPAVKKIIFAQDRWDPNVDYKWDPIKSTWLSLLHNSQKDIFIEASPPNIMRLESIKRNFSEDMTGVISISSPYMQITSAIKKKYHNMVGNKKLRPRDQIPEKLIRKATDSWVLMAKAQRNNVKSNPSMPLVTYEQFCKNPQKLIKAFCNQAQIQTKSYKPQKIGGKKFTGITGIMDMTCKNLSFLSLKEIEILTRNLKRHRSLLRFFGYQLLTTQDVTAMYEEHMPLVIDGMHSRLHR